MGFVIGVFAGLYILWQLLMAALEGLAWGAGIGLAGAVIWWSIRRE